ncbi:MAG: hypothetical protein KDD82_08025, partial [Planctomycetes bacterium]|nr:hypothetical protein [Planctomycetota bacterium]
VDAGAAAPQWSAAAIQALPPLADPSFPAALHALQASTPGERAAQARLQSAREGLEGWGTASDADLATWADGASDLPLRALGPLALLRPPTVAAFHHGSPLPPPADTSKLDDHLEDQAIQVAFCDPAGRRYVTVGHRTLKLWSWPATLEKSVALPASWTLTQCLVVQPQAERVFLGGRQEVPKPFDPGRIVRNAALASYALGNAEVELHEELSGVLQRDRVQALALHDDVLVCGTNKGYLTVFHARNTLELVARGELPDNVNARGLAFLDDPTHFYAASGDDSDPLYGLYRYRIEHALCELDATEVELEHPRRDLRVFTSLASCPPYGLYVGQSGEGTVVRYGAEQRKDVFVDPRCGRAHGRSAVALAAAPQRGWLVSASGWAEWEADDADDVVRGGRLPGEPATLCVWDLETSTLLGRFAGLHPQDGFSSVAVTPDGSRVLAGTACGDVLGWALE